jgi:hypothetical protein
VVFSIVFTNLVAPASNRALVPDVAARIRSLLLGSCCSPTGVGLFCHGFGRLCPDSAADARAQLVPVLNRAVPARVRPLQPVLDMSPTASQPLLCRLSSKKKKKKKKTGSSITMAFSFASYVSIYRCQMIFMARLWAVCCPLEHLQ